MTTRTSRPSRNGASVPQNQQRPAVQRSSIPSAVTEVGGSNGKVSLKERLGLPGKDRDSEPEARERGVEDQQPHHDTGAEALTDPAVIPAVPAGTPGPAPAPQAQSQPQSSGRPKPGAARRTRKARLRLARLDPWSVMKTSFLFSIAAGIMLVVAVYVVWSVIGASSLFDSVNDIVKSVVSTPGDTTPFRIQEYVNTQKVMGVAALLACVDVVIFTALATLGSFLYNLAATMLGGLEVTLAED